MKKNVITIFALIFTVLNYGQDAKQLITEMMNTLGGKQNFYAKGNVSYDYEYINQTAKIHLKSKETYVFDKELSYAKYSEHSLLGDAGKVIEGFDGQNAWVSINGILSTDEKANGIARFLRKTNYYWFAMFFKLLDEGVHHELMYSFI